MKRELPAHVYRKKGVLYFQRRGYKTVRVASPEGTPEFHAEYARLLAGDRPIRHYGANSPNKVID